MKNVVTFALAVGAAVVGLPLLLWILFATIDASHYLGLARGALLLWGVLGTGYGLILQRLRIVVCSILLLALGFVTFFCVPR